MAMKLMNLLFKSVKYLLKKFNVHIYVKELQEENHINYCRNNVSGNKIYFYSETSIRNLKQDLSKIIIGENTHVRGQLLIWRHGGRIHVGNNSYVGQGTKIWSGNAEGIKIGHSVLISHNVTIIDSDSHEIDAIQRANSFIKLTQEGHPQENKTVKTAPIIIDDYAWISYNVCILKGVKIGEGAIIGAGAVVTKDVPAYTLAAG